MMKVSKITINQDMKLVRNPTSKRIPVGVVTWDPQPSSMTRVDPQPQDLYPEPPLVA